MRTNYNFLASHVIKLRESEPEEVFSRVVMVMPGEEENVEYRFRILDEFSVLIEEIYMSEKRQFQLSRFRNGWLHPFENNQPSSAMERLDRLSSTMRAVSEIFGCEMYKRNVVPKF